MRLLRIPLPGDWENPGPDTFPYAPFRMGRTALSHFLSWNPVETPAPDFHRTEHFGRMLFI